MICLIHKVFDVLCPKWKEKLLGVTSDGAAVMTGRLSGVATLTAATEGEDSNGTGDLAHFMPDCLTSQYLTPLCDALKDVHWVGFCKSLCCVRTASNCDTAVFFLQPSPPRFRSQRNRVL
ncbi:hypothetical protein PsorP6_002197 [Peronosclerospora sorghi]|uniref:Uncharacterized protein n=1 Tax=Peronosclerospora sorghi TaxID=230839 RepID=A0ACC0WVW2_9STRA|nr:hypothetical protein PsorP6_002197 [Peronosclerospora sorghi]